MCSDVSFYLQFATFLMLLACVPAGMCCVKLYVDMKPKPVRRRGMRR
jgi:hypothetical protein